jgi:hypothetical protein
LKRVPILHEQLGLARHRFGRIVDVGELAPLVDQRQGHHRGQAGIHQAHDHGLAQVRILRAHAHAQFAQYLADLNNGIRIVDFHHQRLALEIDDRAPHLLALRVAEANYRIDLRFGVHGIAPGKSEKRCAPWRQWAPAGYSSGKGPCGGQPTQGMQPMLIAMRVTCCGTGSIGAGRCERRPGVGLRRTIVLWLPETVQLCTCGI